jgi:hypothetical protein
MGQWRFLAYLAVLGVAIAWAVPRYVDDETLAALPLPTDLSVEDLALPELAGEDGVGGSSGATVADLMANTEACVAAHGAGAFADETGACFAACPRGYERDAVPRSARDACRTTQIAPAHVYEPGARTLARDAGPICPPGTDAYEEGGCHRCPSGYARSTVHNATGSTACVDETPHGPRHAKARKVAEHCGGGNTRAVTATGRCSRCPDGFEHVDDRSCTRIGGCASIDPVAGHGRVFAEPGDACWSCPIGHDRNDAEAPGSACETLVRVTPEAVGAP